MQVRHQKTARLGHVVHLEIVSPDGFSVRTVRWTLASSTDRPAGELGVHDTTLGSRLLGARAGDEFSVQPAGGEAFDVTVLQVFG